MSLRPLDVTLLALPSFRTVAYLCAFRELGLYPAELILLPGALPNRDTVLQEAREHNYAELYFDVTLDPLEWCRACGTRITQLHDSDVNGDAVFAALSQSQSGTVIFSASGILNQRILALDKTFIHVHPGSLPDYRGSTCFYYSLLETNEVASTSFLMREGIDTGPVIASSRFQVNVRLAAAQKQFLDHILDPFIRAQTLKKVLRMLSSGAPMPSAPNNKAVGEPMCYVMHPLLRMLTARRVAGTYVAARPTGIIGIPTTASGE